MEEIVKKASSLNSNESKEKLKLSGKKQKLDKELTDDEKEKVKIIF